MGFANCDYLTFSCSVLSGYSFFFPAFSLPTSFAALGEKVTANDASTSAVERIRSFTRFFPCRRFHKMRLYIFLRVWACGLNVVSVTSLPYLHFPIVRRVDLIRMPIYWRRVRFHRYMFFHLVICQIFIRFIWHFLIYDKSCVCSIQKVNSVCDFSVACVGKRNGPHTLRFRCIFFFLLSILLRKTLFLYFSDSVNGFRTRALRLIWYVKCYPPHFTSCGKTFFRRSSSVRNSRGEK